MVALGFGFGWLGYSLGLYGYCLVKGYDVSLLQLMNPVNVYQWPAGGPPPIPPTQVFPTGRKAQAAPATLA